MVQRHGERPVRMAGILAALGLVVSLFSAALQPAAAQDRLVGQLLVATPELADPNFKHTVIYLLRHDASGALGLVVNRPMGAVPLDRLLSLMDGNPAGEQDATDNDSESQDGLNLLVFYGGPVEPYRGFTLHSRDVMFEDSVPVDDETAFNVQGEILHALADGAGPARMMFMLGYAGWGAGQLEGELDRGDWHVIAADSTLVFSKDPAHTWERAVAQFGTEL